MSALKVLLVSPLPPPPGGMQTWTADYIEYFRRSGELDVTLVNQGLIGRRATDNVRKRNVFTELVRAARIIRELKRGLRSGVDLVHLNSPCSGIGIFRDYLCVKAAAKRKVPVIFHCHCNVEKQIGTGGRSVAYLGKTLALCDKVLVLNSTSARYLKDTFGVESETVFNFIDPKLITGKKTVNEKLASVVFVGNVIGTKGIRELLAAAGEFPEIGFKIVGKKVPGLFEDIAPGNVTFTGPVSHGEVVGYLDEADVFVFPTYTEGFSVALAEAMARGLPVVTTNVGANADMLCGKGGLLIEPRDGRALVAAIREIADAGCRRSMSAFNAERAKDFSIDTVMKGFLDLYEGIYEKSHNTDQ